MSIRSATIVFTLCLPPCAAAQQDEPLPGPAGQEQPEELVVIGQRQRLQLRLQMLDAEKLAYDVFNQFNDEQRFNISCRIEQPTGTHMHSVTQNCQPLFEIEATAAHGRDYYEGLRDYLNQWAGGNPNPTERTVVTHVPVEAAIASQQAAYRSKMRQVAEEHPEFLDALVDYTELRQRYEAATRVDREKDE